MRTFNRYDAKISHFLLVSAAGGGRGRWALRRRWGRWAWAVGVGAGGGRRPWGVGVGATRPAVPLRTMEEPTAQPPAILAGDAEREQSTQLLSTAVVEGRLTLEEFSDRVERAQAARTREELATLTRDLPAAAPPLAATPSSEIARPQERHVAFCSRLVRSGPWELAARSEFRSIFGTITLDLSQARLAGSEVELQVYNLFGTVTVIVPESVDVSVSGGGMFASQVIQPHTAAPVPGAPKLRIVARGPGGTLYVRAKKSGS